MKNNDEMYQSLLSRYDEYQEKKKKRILILKRTVPALVSFCLVAGIGLGCWKHFGSMNSDPMVSDTIDEPAITTTSATDFVTTEVTTEKQSATQTSSKNAAVTTAATTSKANTNRTITADKVRTTTAAVPAATSRNTAPTTAKTTGVQSAKTTVIYTQPVTSTTDDAYKEKPSTSTTTDVIHEGPGVATTSSSAVNPEPTFNAQPIIFNSADEAIDTIKQNDVSSYAEEYRSAYRKMFDRFNDDGVVYRPVTDNTDELEQKDTVILLPNAAYEDTGIMYKVVYNGNTYQVSFRYADTSVIKSPYNVPKYLYDRFKRTIYDEIVVGHQTYSILYSSDQSQVSAAFFIDEEHYFYTSAYTTKGELIAFLELFNYESVIL
ncbi:hypothetical protein [Ruminococcus flavefaciens]|uniref:hypothetical protein n=1 Tax=Ruminococcus flavefaciens TaxID=1265 RepID=UPI000490D43B|nr:hypothetical protein [Ruminococcus flavefaciens]